MTLPQVLLTRPLGSHPTGTRLTLPPGRASSLVASGVARYLDATDATATTSTGTPDAGPPTEPPRTGRGSSRAAWASYASALGHDVNNDDTRDDIIDKIEAATPPSTRTGTPHGAAVGEQAPA
jgi:hypothetical protein